MFRLLPALLGLLLLGASVQVTHADDGIFAPAPAAAPFVNFDGRGFLLHGKRTFIASGGMEYARVPHQLWRDRLLRMKRAGLNCVEVYNFWNFHEPYKGQFNFSGDADLDGFLKLVKSLGMYAICRLGPYYCAEWDSGGYPIWLRFEPGVRVREDNPPFMAAMNRFWDKLMPIVAANQINHGGAVILVQLENEDPQGWGKEMPNSYFHHLQDKALALGLQVPYFFSGLHHGGQPAGDTPWSSAGRTNPWFSTEFWSVWFDNYGENEGDVAAFDRFTWNIIADGGNGYNYYMMHGGTNFAYWNDNEDAASYDYGATIGQAGDLRPLYYRFKRAALFARSFASVLEDSDNATDEFKGAATEKGLNLRARKSPAGTILFLSNPGGSAVKTQVKEADGTLFPSAGLLTVAPSQTLPIVRAYALLPGVTLERSTPLLGILPQGSTTTLVAYGAVGDSVEMRFHLAAPATDIKNLTKGDGSTLTLNDAITDPIHGASFRVGGQTIRILTMNTALSDHTWFVDNNVIVGPEYVGEAATANGKLHITVESKDGTAASGWLYGPNSALRSPLLPDPTRILMPNVPTLTDWQTRPGDTEAQPKFPDAAWKASIDPLPMGADGDISAYAWYRATVIVPKAGTYRFQPTEAGDWVSVFVNGRYAASGPAKQPLSVTLPAGTETLAVLTAHNGRPKLAGYLGQIDHANNKGLSGPVVLAAGEAQSQAVTAWRVKRDDAPDRAHPPTDTTGAGWSDATAGPDVFNHQPGFAWYRATLSAASNANHRLHFENVDDNGTVYLNGKKIGAHEGWGVPFDVSLDTGWREGVPNELAVLVENTAGTGGIQGPVTLQTVATGSEIPVQGWKMRGGPGNIEAAGWKALSAASIKGGAPAWYRAAFVTTPPGETGPHPILRLQTTGLSRGFVWLNGHNLGRYPERVPAPGLYLPECWLVAGRNELVIFDEDGHSPAQAALTIEQAASRVVVSLTEK